MARAYKALLEHPDYSPEVDELVDFSRTSVKHLTSEDFRMMSGLIGIDAPVDRGVFYTPEEALSWLHPGKPELLLKAYAAADKTMLELSS